MLNICPNALKTPRPIVLVILSLLDNNSTFYPLWFYLQHLAKFATETLWSLVYSAPFVFACLFSVVILHSGKTTQ